MAKRQDQQMKQMMTEFQDSRRQGKPIQIIQAGQVAPTQQQVVPDTAVPTNQFIGGAFQMGEFARQPAKSGTEALYGALSGIASDFVEGASLRNRMDEADRKENYEKSEQEWRRVSSVADGLATGQVNSYIVGDQTITVPDNATDVQRQEAALSYLKGQTFDEAKWKSEGWLEAQQNNSIRIRQGTLRSLKNAERAEADRVDRDSLETATVLYNQKLLEIDTQDPIDKADTFLDQVDPDTNETNSQRYTRLMGSIAGGESFSELSPDEQAFLTVVQDLKLKSTREAASQQEQAASNLGRNFLTDLNNWSRSPVASEAEEEWIDAQDDETKKVYSNFRQQPNTANLGALLRVLYNQGQMKDADGKIVGQSADQRDLITRTIDNLTNNPLVGYILAGYGERKTAAQNTAREAKAVNSRQNERLPAAILYGDFNDKSNRSSAAEILNGEFAAAARRGGATELLKTVKLLAAKEINYMEVSDRNKFLRKLANEHPDLRPYIEATGKRDPKTGHIIPDPNNPIEFKISDPAKFDEALFRVAVSNREVQEQLGRSIRNVREQAQAAVNTGELGGVPIAANGAEVPLRTTQFMLEQLAEEFGMNQDQFNAAVESLSKDNIKDGDLVFEGTVIKEDVTPEERNLFGLAILNPGVFAAQANEYFGTSINFVPLDDEALEGLDARSEFVLQQLQLLATDAPEGASRASGTSGSTIGKGVNDRVSWVAGQNKGNAAANVVDGGRAIWETDPSDFDTTAPNVIEYSDIVLSQINRPKYEEWEASPEGKAATPEQKARRRDAMLRMPIRPDYTPAPTMPRPARFGGGTVVVGEALPSEIDEWAARTNEMAGETVVTSQAVENIKAFFREKNATQEALAAFSQSEFGQQIAGIQDGLGNAGLTTLDQQIPWNPSTEIVYRGPYRMEGYNTIPEDVNKLGFSLQKDKDTGDVLMDGDKLNPYDSGRLWNRTAYFIRGKTKYKADDTWINTEEGQRWKDFVGAAGKQLARDAWTLAQHAHSGDETTPAVTEASVRFAVYSTWLEELVKTEGSQYTGMFNPNLLSDFNFGEGNSGVAEAVIFGAKRKNMRSIQFANDASNAASSLTQTEMFHLMSYSYFDQDGYGTETTNMNNRQASLGERLFLQSESAFRQPTSASTKNNYDTSEERVGFILEDMSNFTGVNIDYQTFLDVLEEQSLRPRLEATGMIPKEVDSIVEKNEENSNHVVSFGGRNVLYAELTTSEKIEYNLGILQSLGLSAPNTSQSIRRHNARALDRIGLMLQNQTKTRQAWFGTDDPEQAAKGFLSLVRLTSPAFLMGNAPGVSYTGRGPAAISQTRFTISGRDEVMVYDALNSDDSVRMKGPVITTLPIVKSKIKVRTSDDTEEERDITYSGKFARSMPQAQAILNGALPNNVLENVRGEREVAGIALWYGPPSDVLIEELKSKITDPKQLADFEKVVEMRQLGVESTRRQVGLYGQGYHIVTGGHIIMDYLTITGHPEAAEIQRALNQADGYRDSGEGKYVHHRNRMPDESTPFVYVDMDRVARGQMPNLVVLGIPVLDVVHDGHFDQDYKKQKWPDHSRAWEKRLEGTRYADPSDTVLMREAGSTSWALQLVRYREDKERERKLQQGADTYGGQQGGN